MTRRLLAAVATIAFVAACSSDPAGPSTPMVLDGLVESAALDTLGNAPPTPQNPAGPGTITGTVLAPSEPGAGNDSLQTAPRIVGAVVTAYPVTGSDPLELGPEAASILTGADGKFVLPTLPAGDYVVTIEPPTAQAATYHGQWLRGMIHADSGDHHWWLVLAER
jgi:hypothetical protein